MERRLIDFLMFCAAEVERFSCQFPAVSQGMRHGAPPPSHAPLPQWSFGLCFAQVKLKDSLVSSLQFHKARDTELAWIDALANLTAAKTDTSVKGQDEEHNG